MKWARSLAVAVLCLSACVGSAWANATPASEIISHGRFKNVAIYRPRGDVKRFVLFLSGNHGWNDPAPEMAAALAEEGALVAGVDVPQFLRDLNRDGENCVFPDGDFENLSHFVQAYYKVPTYLTPVLAGYASGGALAYAMVAQSSPGLFSGALSIDFCPELHMRMPLCRGEGVHFTRRAKGHGLDLRPALDLRVPWIAVQAQSNAVCAGPATRAFVSQVPRAEMVTLPAAGRTYTVAANLAPHIKGALARITAGRSERLPPPPKSLADIPVIEVPATAQTNGDTFAVLFSGDGGWAGLDRQVAQALAARGIPVAGLDSLRYFWSARTPDSVAQDLDRMLRYYASQWSKSRVLLIGYSQGADVLPFAVNRLPPATKERVDLTTLLGVSSKALFEFHLTNWISDGRNGLPVEPEIDKLPAEDVLCLYGTDDDETICPKLKPSQARVMQMPGGHHFGGDYDRVVALIIDQAGNNTPSSTAARNP